MPAGWFQNACARLRSFEATIQLAVVLFGPNHRPYRVQKVPSCP